MKVSVNWLKDFVKISPPLEKAAEDLTLAGLEVKKIEPSLDGKDMLFEIEITSNRPDWLSHLGVARELAAVQNLSLKQIEIPKAVNRSIAPGWKVTVKDLESCPYYTGVYIEGVQNLSTPDFIKDRLAACGLRPIHVVVDITNYVLLEIGQPLHAFDADLLSGQEIIIRKAKADEKFLAINGQQFSLTSQDLVIADGDRALALAGVMGGKDSEVSAKTRNLFLESAFFLPRAVRHTSRRLGLSSDSSYRFERRVDPEGVDLGRERALALIQQYAKPRFISAMIKAGQKPLLQKTTLHLSAQEVAKKIGAPIKSHQIGSALLRLGFETKQDTAESVRVSIPSFRADITENIDLIEEVARIYGFDQIKETLPTRPPLLTSPSPLYRLEDSARQYFPGAGCYETVTFSLISSKGFSVERDLARAVYVNNPQNQELCWMRPTFLTSFLQVIQKNLSWGAARVPIFELANLYHLGADHFPKEEKTLGLALCGKFREKGWADTERAFTFYDVKGITAGFLARSGILEAEFVPAAHPLFLNPGFESILVKGKKVGLIGEALPKLTKLWDIDRPVFFAELSLSALADCAERKAVYQEVPRFPGIERDLSLQVSESVHAETIAQDIREMGKGLLTKVEVFDLFQGGRVPKGHKNLAFRLIYQSLERTLVSEEVNSLHTRIADTVVKKYQASFQA